MKKQKVISSPLSSATLTIFSDFMGSLQRLFKIGVYYPEGHTILDQALDRFLNNLDELADTNPTISFRNNSEGLRLQGVKLSPKTPFTREFQEILSLLAISELTIHKQITRSEINLFVQNLLKLRARISHSRQFQQFDFDVFPSSVTIKQKEFLTSSTEAKHEGPSSESSQNFIQFIESLTNFGLNKEEIAKYKKIVESLPSHLLGQQEQTKGLPAISWDDVARLLAKSLNNEGPQRKSKKTSQASVNTLASILQKFEKETTDEKSRDAIHLLVSSIKTTIPKESVTKEKVEQHSFPSVSEVTVEQIQTHIKKYKVAPTSLSTLPELAKDRETLSIVLQLCQSNQPPENQVRIQEIFREILSKKISEEKWEIIGNGVLDIIKTGVIPRITFILRNLAEPLRNSRFHSSLHLFLWTAKLCTLKNEKLTLWPYLVNELLLQGGGKSKTTYNQLCLFSSTLTLDEMRDCLPQLESLDSFKEKNIAPDLLHGVTRKGFPLFAFLLKTDIERYISERVISKLKNAPKDWLIKGISPLLDTEQQSHKLFLYSYLRQPSTNQFPKSLQKAAADIIVETLNDLPQHRRSESWILEAIGALGKIKTVEAVTSLKSIQSAKKMLFIPTWPQKQRKAAAVALAAMKQYHGEL